MKMAGRTRMHVLYQEPRIQFLMLHDFLNMTVCDTSLTTHTKMKKKIASECFILYLRTQFS